MRELPILFSAPMVRAILDGRKTQTRRVVSPWNLRFFDPDRGLYRPPANLLPVAFEEACEFRNLDGTFVWRAKARDHQVADWTHWQGRPNWAPRDRLWVRETWQLHERFSDLCRIVYAASQGCGWSEMHRDFPADLAGDLVARPFQDGWRPSLHMPRWASRLTLEVVEVRVERLQDISADDAEAEGLWRGRARRHLFWQSVADCRFNEGRSHKAAFAELWDSVGGETSWAANPWVWVVSFRRVEQEAQAA